MSENNKPIFIALSLTVVLILGYSISSIFRKPMVVSTNPVNDAEEIDPKAKIKMEIIFNTPVSESIKDKIFITPKTEGTFTFEDQSLIFKKPKKVIFSPSKDLYSFAEYKVDIKEPENWLGIKGKDYSFIFNTKHIPWNELSPEQQKREIQVTEEGVEE